MTRSTSTTRRRRRCCPRRHRAPYARGDDRASATPRRSTAQGQNAKRMLEEARERLAASVGCDPIEVVFTSGGTEAVNLGIKGLFWARGTGAPRILAAAAASTTPPSTPSSGSHAHEGADVEWSRSTRSAGSTSPASSRRSPRDPADVALATLLAANNEVGTLQPCRGGGARRGATACPVHVDAVSAFGHAADRLPRALRPRAAVSCAQRLGAQDRRPGRHRRARARRAGDGRAAHARRRPAAQVRSGTQDVAAAVVVRRRGRARRRRAAGRERAPARRCATAWSPACGRGAGGRAHGDPDPAGAAARQRALHLPRLRGRLAAVPARRRRGRRSRPARPARPACPSPRTCCSPWAAARRGRAARCGSPSGRTTTEADVDAFLAALPAAYAQAPRRHADRRRSRSADARVGAAPSARGSTGAAQLGA